MARVRYQVDEVPPNAWAEAWFPTAPLSPAGTYSVRQYIYGYPGTRRVPSPSPRFDRTASHLAGDGYANGSDVAPDWFAPQIWVDEFTNHKHVGGDSYGISYMPKPVAAPVPPIVPLGTLGPLGPSNVAMGGRKVGGRRSMHWPRVIPRWPGLGGGGG